jgi:hypothetical protein
MLSNHPPGESLEAARRAIDETDAVVEDRDSNTLTVSAGSRLRYRLTGAGPLPLILHFDVHEEDGATVLVVTQVSDEGWYALTTRRHQELYEDEFVELLHKLKAEGFSET